MPNNKLLKLFKYKKYKNMEKKYFIMPSRNQQKLFDVLDDYNNRFKNIKNLETYENNLNILSSDYKRKLLNSVISENQINKLLLLNELENLKVDIKTEKDIDYVFNRYMYKAVGCLFKSRKWKLKEKADDYLIYQNLINSDNLYDSNTKESLILLFSFFSRNLCNYSIHIDKYFINRDNLFYIFFIFIKK